MLMRELGVAEGDHDEVIRIALQECPITREFVTEMREHHVSGCSCLMTTAEWEEEGF